MIRLICSVLVVLAICPAAMGQTKGRTYRCITWEKFKASGPELKQIGWLATRPASQIESSDWSIGCETLDRDQAKFGVYKNYVGELGAKHGRLQSGWAKCEKQKGVYDFAWLDESVYGLNEQGVKPWMCLCYGNPIYKSTIQLGSTLGPIVHSEEAMAAWLKYVEATVLRYRDVINEWEIWNEPFGQGKDYAIMVLATAELIKKIQPNAVVLVTAIHDSDRHDVLEALNSADKLDLVDYGSTTPTPESRHDLSNRREDAEGTCGRQSKYKVYQGEVGCPSILEWTHALAYYPWTEYSQPKWNLRRMAGDRVRSIPSSVFTIIDLKYPNMLQSFGLIRSNLLLEFIYKRPTYYAVQHMMSFFDDARQTGRAAEVPLAVAPSDHGCRIRESRHFGGLAVVRRSDSQRRLGLGQRRSDHRRRYFPRSVYVEMITARCTSSSRPTGRPRTDAPPSEDCPCGTAP